MPLKYLFTIAFCIFHYLSLAQTAFTKQVWINEPDMPVSVTDIVQQPHGYLWLCTGNAIYRYNGKTFTKIPDSINASSTAICAADDVVYAGYDNGTIAQVTEQGTIPLVFKNGKINSSISTVKVLFGNILLAATEDAGLYIVINGNLISINTANGLSDDFISDIAIGKNKILLTTDNGVNVLSFANSRLAIDVFGTENGLPDVIATCVGVAPDARTFWIGTQKGDIAIYDDSSKKITPLKTTVPRQFGQVNDLFVLNEHHAWAVTENDWMLELKRRGDSVSIKPALMPVKLKRVIKDKTDNIWCATGKGLLLNTGLYASSLLLPGSFKLSDYTAAACDDSKNLWFTQENRLFRLKPGKDTMPVRVLSLPTDITCLHFSDAATLWIGTFGRGLYKYTVGGSLEQIAVSSRINEHILSITHKGKELWVASFNGIDLLDISSPPVSSGHYNKHNGIGSDYIYHLHTDAKQRIWMATDGGGIVLYESRRFTKWDTKTGENSEVFYCVTTDGTGNVWGSSIDKGIYQFNGKRWINLTVQQGLQNNNVTSIAANGNNGLIMVNRNGVDRWYANDGQFRHFSRRLGIGIDSVSRMLNCVASDNEGNVYVPYQAGIILFHPPQKHASIRPDVRIRKQALFFKDLPHPKQRFSHDDNHISFTYDGISFSNADRLHFRYKLEGYDDTWVYTNNETVPFAQLNPGAYTFRIQASLSDNFSNAAEDRFSFYIAKPFWQTPWFVITAALLTLLTMYVTVKLRERNIEAMNRLQRERLVYEYEHLKSQVNPHFLFNSFNTLVNMIEEDQDAAVDYTVHLSDLYRSMLSYKDRDLISLKEEYEIVKSYMHIQKSRFRDALVLHEKIDMRALNKKIVPLALQILLENAVKHNIVSVSKPLHIYVTANGTEIIVRNNLQEKVTKDKHTGIGIENIRKRYQLLTRRSISYGVENNEYIVKLPLL